MTTNSPNNPGNSVNPDLTQKGQPRKGSPGHGGARPGAGRPKNLTPSATGSAYERLAEARAKRETYKAGMAELEFKKASGQLLDADVVAATWVNQVGIAKGRLLSLPARLAPAVLGLGDLRAIEATIREAIHEVLTELSADPQP